MNTRTPIGKCMRCSRTCRQNAQDFTAWNTQFSKGRAVGLICPQCQTDEENAEAVINEATIDYRTMRRDAFGCWRAYAKEIA